MPAGNALKILVIDDDEIFRDVMADNLPEHRIDFAVNFDAGRRKLLDGRFDLCFIDLQLTPGEHIYSGLKLVEIAAARGLYCAVVSGHDSKDDVAKAFQLGCRDFYGKGTGVAGIRQIVDRYLQRREPPKMLDVFKDRFVTEDPQTREAVTGMLKFAASDLPIMLLGPSGTGKTSLARLVHELSGRPGQFVPINCSAFNEELLEVELFGSKIGAFTGAVESRKGKLAMADEGTLFLDEVGSMSLKMQSKLLKAIEEKEFYPVGSEKPETSDFRIVSATWHDPQEMVKDGAMRRDFIARIRGKTTELKPLAERKSDIFPLIWFFTRNGPRLGFSQEAERMLLEYPWPDNVRELETLVKMLIESGESFIIPETVKPFLQAAKPGRSCLLSDDLFNYARIEGFQALVSRIMGETIQRALTENDGVRSEAAAALRISRNRLYQILSRKDVTAWL